MRSTLQASSDATVGLWDAGTGKPLGQLRADQETPIVCLSVMGDVAAGGCNDKCIKIWDLQTQVRCASCC